MSEAHAFVAWLVGAFAALLRLHPGAEWGPAHIVLSDYNLLDGNLDFCEFMIDCVEGKAETPEQYREYIDSMTGHGADELMRTRQLLQALRRWPESVREAFMDEYGGE